MPRRARSSTYVASAGEGALYLDSSAIVKVVAGEPQSVALRVTVAGRQVVSSELSLAEVPRAIRRIAKLRGDKLASDFESSMRALLRATSYVPLDRRIVLRAGSFAEPFLRALDAIHLASALTVANDLQWFVTYDETQAHPACIAGLPLLAPA